jgi:predicted secreted hydrolase
VRRTLAALVVMLPLAAAGAAGNGAADYPPVVPGYRLEFPRDFASHPQFRLEWWYVTGWLETAAHESLGFQITFFRTRPSTEADNPSRFAARQLLIAHCALSDPARGSLWHDQRIRRQGFELAEAPASEPRVWIDDWQLSRQGDRYVAKLRAHDFALELTLSASQPPLLNGDQGFSRKAASERAASYYYSEPHLKVQGRIERANRPVTVTGEAWLDHEWSSEYLDPNAVGWDWVGVNLDDGGALMAFRLRDPTGRATWSAGTWRDAGGGVHALGADQVEFTAQRSWRSPRSGVDYPVSFAIRAGSLHFELEPLIEDQENDTRLSSGAIYWEGAVTAVQGSHRIGRGYLELTGYGAPLSLLR